MIKRNKKKIINMVLIISFVLLLVLKVKADSGYDVDFGGGGSSGGGDAGGIIELILLLIRNPIAFIIVIIVIAILAIYYNKKDKTLHNTTNMGLTLFHHLELKEEAIKPILGDIDINKLVQERYDQFVSIQTGWMNFDHDLLRTQLTDEMYNQYAVQLDTMQLKNQQNIMNDFTFYEGMITGLEKEGSKVTMTMQIVTSFYDYMMENGNVVRGKQDRKVVMQYELTFVKMVGHNGICPNCGAKLPKSNKCSYCNSVVPNVSSDWVMAKKQALQQK